MTLTPARLADLSRRAAADDAIYGDCREPSHLRPACELVGTVRVTQTPEQRRAKKAAASRLRRAAKRDGAQGRYYLRGRKARPVISDRDECYQSVAEAARAMGVPHSTLYGAVRRGLRAAGRRHDTIRETNMSVKPKYDLGQRLWPIQKVSKYWIVQRPFDFAFFMLRGNGDVLYSYTHEYGFMECDVFPDQASAAAECQTRNR